MFVCVGSFPCHVLLIGRATRIAALNIHKKIVVFHVFLDVRCAHLSQNHLTIGES